MEKFIDRHDAGKIIATYLTEYIKRPNALVLALPRGGVPIGYEIAQALALPLEIFIVRKLGVPGHEELAMGAIASGGTIIFNELIINQLNLEKLVVNQVIHAEQEELMRREQLYRGNLPFPSLKEKTIIIVDDGIATGSTIRAAVLALRKQQPASMIIAVPVAASSTYDELAELVDRIVCPLKPLNFYAVGLWYENFNQTTDAEVVDLLAKSRQRLNRQQDK